MHNSAQGCLAGSPAMYTGSDVIVVSFFKASSEYLYCAYLMNDYISYKSPEYLDATLCRSKLRLGNTPLYFFAVSDRFCRVGIATASS